MRRAHETRQNQSICRGSNDGHQMRSSNNLRRGKRIIRTKSSWQGRRTLLTASDLDRADIANRVAWDSNLTVLCALSCITQLVKSVEPYPPQCCYLEWTKQHCRYAEKAYLPLEAGEAGDSTSQTSESEPARDGQSARYQGPCLLACVHRDPACLGKYPTAVVSIP